MARPQKKNNDNGCANLGFEAKLWAYGASRAGNSNFFWLQRIVRHGARSDTSAAQITRRLGLA